MARSFNGTTDLIKATGGASYAGTRTAFSMGCWVNGAGQQNKAFQTDSRNSDRGFIFFSSQNVVGGTKCRLVSSHSVTGASNIDITSTAVILDSTWHHVLVTLDASGNWKLYIDGALDSSGGPVTSDTVTESWEAHGCLARNTNAAFFAGKLAHAANWTRTLSAADAASLAAGLPPSHLGPAHYWPLWGTDSPEPDLGVVTHATGTLTGTSAAAEARVGVALVGAPL